METEDACPAPEGPTSSGSSMWAALLSLEALQRTEIWWFKDEQDRVQLLHPSLPIAAKTTAGAGATPTISAGGDRGDPQGWFCSGAPVAGAEEHQEFTG